MTLLWPKWTVSVIHMLLIVKPFCFERCNNSSNMGSYSSYTPLSVMIQAARHLAHLVEAACVSRKDRDRI